MNFSLNVSLFLHIAEVYARFRFLNLFMVLFYGSEGVSDFYTLKKVLLYSTK